MNAAPPLSYPHGPQHHHPNPHTQLQQQEAQKPQPQQQDEESNIQTSSSSSSSTNLRRGPWSPEEDRKLLDSINLFGATNWVRISQSIGTRTPKQCRERYHQNLKPSLNRNPISPEEGQLIEELVGKYGKRWAEIARHLNGRSDNAIKNWWNGGANRRRRASSQAIFNEPIQLHQQPLHHHLQPLEYNQHYSPAFNTQIFQQQQQQQLPHQIQQIPGPGPIHHQIPVLQHSHSQPHGINQTNQSFPSPLNHSQSSTAAPTSNSNSNPTGPNPNQSGQSNSQQPLMMLSSLSQQQMLPPVNSSRSVSMNQEIFQQQPGVKRFLEEQHIPTRRHSTQTIMTAQGPTTIGGGGSVSNNLTNGSNSQTSQSTSSPFSASPLSRGPSSRNSSISFDPTSHPPSSSGFFSEYSNNNSRRSSIAPDVFPNPFHYSNNVKRQNSATYLSPSFTPHRGSASGLPSSLSTLTYTPNDSSDGGNGTESSTPIFKSNFNFKQNEQEQAAKLIQKQENNGHAPGPNQVTNQVTNEPPLKAETSDENTKPEDGEVDGVEVEGKGEGKKKVMNISNLLG
ncbi:Myb-like DNA-binding protein BAS1 [Wickerhamomyces ciferrii]|uniref:Myb-like DNA-binding protein BAS1 n=1 Tax=Wickerhamomyces ciferrii (strain ATCC 14091 / BCRC 22168 / CBS 111 / JCM 3599 / NBRC 0793 / NRRL Y-1031 F-60-10) TaxID=1206466 RepID=K0KVJ0_WICCF|nr:Myb-like DNA-binding protein BAS1 [Wickerhamomyces ciferrii]CCH45947.1 Myb-like DNA-binding protein BAS1 [Wickerhamomyces ciferrii]